MELKHDMKRWRQSETDLWCRCIKLLWYLPLWRALRRKGHLGGDNEEQMRGVATSHSPSPPSAGKDLWSEAKDWSNKDPSSNRNEFTGSHSIIKYPQTLYHYCPRGCQSNIRVTVIMVIVFCCSNREKNDLCVYVSNWQNDGCEVMFLGRDF